MGAIDVSSSKHQHEIKSAIPLPLEFQHELFIDYDISKYDFLTPMRTILGEAPDADLSKLHLSAEGQKVIERWNTQGLKGHGTAGRNLGPRTNPWNGKFASARHGLGEVYQLFEDNYHRFLREIVMKDLNTKRIVFQKMPTFRCHLPHTGAVGRPHRDAQYFHPPSEVNYWVPLTRVYGSNSLQTESARGASDFHPIEADLGQIFRFYGNQVWHYNIPNETESTRISFDVRVMREEEWCPESFKVFRIGEYYSVMTLDGLLQGDDLFELKSRLNAQARFKPPKTKQKFAQFAASQGLPL